MGISSNGYIVRSKERRAYCSILFCGSDLPLSSHALQKKNLLSLKRILTCNWIVANHSRCTLNIIAICVFDFIGTFLKFLFPATASDIANYKLWAYCWFEQIMLCDANHILQWKQGILIDWLFIIQFKIEIQGTVWGFQL